jgi:hypothetical protein
MGSTHDVPLIRPDGHSVQIYNSGPLVFLYDAASADAIRAIDPFILQGFRGPEEEAADEVLARVAAEGLLLVYELFQDGEIVLELAFGEELTNAERDLATWVGPRSGLLHAPSGLLRIEGYDSLQLGPEEPGDAGAEIEIAPGRYTVSVEWCRGQPEGGPLRPSEFLSLKPAQPGTPAPPLIRFPRGGA